MRRPANGGAAPPAQHRRLARDRSLRSFLDDDDTYLPGKLADEVPLDAATPEIAAVVADASSPPSTRADRPPAELRRMDLLRPVRGNLQLGALLFRRAVVAALRFDESLSVIDD